MAGVGKTARGETNSKRGARRNRGRMLQGTAARSAGRVCGCTAPRMCSRERRESGTHVQIAATARWACSRRAPAGAHGVRRCRRSAPGRRTSRAARRRCPLPPRRRYRRCRRCSGCRSRTRTRSPQRLPGACVRAQKIAPKGARRRSSSCLPQASPGQRLRSCLMGSVGRRRRRGWYGVVVARTGRRRRTARGVQAARAWPRQPSNRLSYPALASSGLARRVVRQLKCFLGMCMARCFDGFASAVVVSAISSRIGYAMPPGSVVEAR